MRGVPRDELAGRAGDDTAGDDTAGDDTDAVGGVGWAGGGPGSGDGPAASCAAAGSGRTGSSIVAADYQSDHRVRPFDATAGR